MAAILALETSSDVCSVALRVDEALFLEQHDEPRAHARVLLPTIAALLARASLDCAQLDGLVYGCGPGSFTGLRIGCAVAQGLAWAHELPTLGVSSLAVLAAATLRAADEDCVGVFTILDARMDECYVAAYGSDASRSILVADRLVARTMLPEIVAQGMAMRPGRWLLAGDGACFATGLSGADVEYVAGTRPDAAALLALAVPRLAAEAVPAMEVRPVYLRDERRWRRQAPRSA